MSGTSAPHQYEASGQCLLSFASHPSPGRDVSSGGHIESARLIWESCEDIFWTSPAIMFHNAYVYMRAETTKIFFLFSLRTLGMHNWILKNDLAIILTNITIVIWFMINNFHNTILISTKKIMWHLLYKHVFTYVSAALPYSVIMLIKKLQLMQLHLVIFPAPINVDQTNAKYSNGKSQTWAKHKWSFTAHCKYVKASR